MTSQRATYGVVKYQDEKHSSFNAWIFKERIYYYAESNENMFLTAKRIDGQRMFPDVIQTQDIKESPKCCYCNHEGSIFCIIDRYFCSWDHVMKYMDYKTQ